MNTILQSLTLDYELPDCGDEGLEPNEGSKGRGQRLVLSEQEKHTVVRMAQIGCSAQEICYILGKPADRMTLTKWYQPLLDLGNSHGNALLRRTQFKKAVEDEDTKMLIWLGKNRLGQADVIVDVDVPLPWVEEDNGDEVSE